MQKKWLKTPFSWTGIIRTPLGHLIDWNNLIKLNSIFPMNSYHAGCSTEYDMIYIILHINPWTLNFLNLFRGPWVGIILSTIFRRVFPLITRERNQLQACTLSQKNSLVILHRLMYKLSLKTKSKWYIFRFLE